MTLQGRNDHELKIGSTTQGFVLAESNGEKMYHVEEQVPQYRNPLEFSQDNWVGGHGQYEFTNRDMYFEGENIDTTQEGVIFLGPLPNEVVITGPNYLDSAPFQFLWCPWASPKLIMATAGKIYYYDNTYWVAATTTVAGVTWLGFYNGLAYAAKGSNTYVTSTDGITWSVTNLTDDDMVGFLSAPNAAGTASVLWGWAGNKLYNTTNGAASGVQWDSGASIGDTSQDINNVFLVNDSIMVGRSDNLYWYDSAGGVHPFMDELKHNRSSANFKHVTHWLTSTYFNLGRGMGEITARDQFAAMGPLTKIDNIGKFGDCVGVTADKDFIYAAFDEGANTHIYKFKEVRREGVLRWEYCPWIKIGARVSATMLVIQHSDTDRRLWFGYTSSSNYSTAYVKLTDNPLATGSGAEFNTAGGFIRMSYEYGTNPYWDMIWQSVITETKGCSGTVTVTPKFRADAATGASTLTSAITTDGVVKTNLTNQITNKRIQFELHLATGASGSTPQITLFRARGVEKPEVTRVHDCVYLVGDSPTESAETLRDLLRTGRSSTDLIRFADLRYNESTAGTDFVYVVMEPGFPSEQPSEHAKGRTPEGSIRVRLREVSYS